MIYLYIFLGLLALFIIYFIVSLFWGKPISISLLYNRVFLSFLTRSPELLTQLGMLEGLGINFHNARLGDESEKSYSKMYQSTEKNLHILKSYNRKHQTASQLLSTDIASWFIDDIVQGKEFRHHAYPFNQMFGVQNELPAFMTTIHPVNNLSNARNYIKRLRRFDVKLGQVLNGVKIRESEGVVPPRFVVQKVLEEMRNFTAGKPTTNALYTVYKDKIDKLKLFKKQKIGLLANCEKAIKDVVYPTYQKLIEYHVHAEKVATNDDGVWKLPKGDKYYAHTLRSNTTTDLTPAEVYEIGLKEVARIEKEMKTILKQLKYPTDDVFGLMHKFSTEKRFQYPDTDDGRKQCLADYQKILDHIDKNLGEIFDIRPKAGVKVERIPLFREKNSAGAYYMTPSLDGSRPGVFYANLRDMKEVSKWAMKTLAYHEAIPGHHFQLAVAQELKGLPFFRKVIPFTAYVEGWALYAEKLAREYGFMGDPFSELGYLQSEIFRAVRLVVDTGIHYKHWTREKAIKYMKDHTGSPDKEVVAEIERYIVMPGQACAYKVGELKIVSLRQKTQKALGKKFDIKKFHNVVLKNGSMPLDILERVVDSYIQAGG
jgi:uncharacterized protein (DUF885 family)